MPLYGSKLEAWQNSGVEKRLGPAARYRDAEVRPILRDQRSITFYPQGKLIQVEKSDDYEPFERVTNPRGKIGGFSAKSRGRLIALCARLDGASLPLFLTLTWPGVWSPDPVEWKRCLNTFFKRLKRAHGDSSGIWKLEPQERGAPHYHILLFGISFIPHQILSQWWFEIVESGDARHLAAGIRIEKVRSREGVMHYASKLYMGKEIQGFIGVGRFWGVFNRSKLPVSVAFNEAVAVPVLKFLLRVARKYIQAQAKASFLRKRQAGSPVQWKRYRCGQPARIFVNNPTRWLDVLMWAEREYYRRQEDAGHPF